jgi:hypothetical protein
MWNVRIIKLILDVEMFFSALCYQTFLIYILALNKWQKFHTQIEKEVEIIVIYSSGPRNVMKK